MLDQLKVHTEHKFQTGEESEVLKWLNENVLAKMDNPIEFEKITKDDSGYKTLVRRSEEEQKSGRANDILVAIQDLLETSVDMQAESAGAISAFEKAILKASPAT